MVSNLTLKYVKTIAADNIGNLMLLDLNGTIFKTVGAGISKTFDDLVEVETGVANLRPSDIGNNWCIDVYGRVT